MLAYSLPLLVLGLAGILNQVADKIIFPFVYPDEAEATVQLGIYGAASKIAMVMAMLTKLSAMHTSLLSSERAGTKTISRYMRRPWSFSASSLHCWHSWLSCSIWIFCAISSALITGRDWGSAYRDGCRNLYGYLFQSFLLVQADWRNALGSLLLPDRLRGAGSDEHTSDSRYSYMACAGQDSVAMASPCFCPIS